MNKKGKNILEGALVGAALGIAAGILVTSDSGKKMGKEIVRDAKKLSGNFYHYLAPQIKKLKLVGETEYNAFIEKGVKQYAKTKKLSLAEKKILTREAKRSWGHIKKHLK